MKKVLFGACCSLLFVQVVFAQISGPDQSWQQEVTYKIDVKLDTTVKALSGSLDITYKNNSPDTLRKIYLQVPANAFHNKENTAVKEMKRFSGGNIDFDEEKDFKLTVLSLQFLSIGNEASFPLQAYDFSDTILDLALPHALSPGDTLKLRLIFRQDFSEPGKIRKKIPPDFILWYPQLSVYDKDGWHPEPFHFMMQPGDVYTEFANMDVSITVPGNYIVVAPGKLVQGDPGWQSASLDTSGAKQSFVAKHDSLKKLLKQQALQTGPRKVRFQMKHLQNFIWSASPDFIHFQPDSLQKIHYFFKSYGLLHWAKKTSHKLNDVLAFLSNHFGNLRAAQLTIVRASRRPFAVPGLAFLTEDSEFEIAYELTAMYIPGLVATNGVKEAWLANGLQVYMGKTYMEKIFGPRGYAKNEAQKEMNWLEKQYPLPSVDEVLRNLTHLYNASGQNEPISKKINAYSDPLSLLFNVYAKSDLFYEMLHYVVGDSLFKAGLRTMVTRYRYRHIHENQLQRLFETVSGQKLDWFFHEWLHGTPTVDYSKGKIKKYQRQDKTWVTEIELKRKGDGIMPVDVDLDLGDGIKVRKRWDGQAKEGKIVFETKLKPTSVHVDPNDRIMDSNRLNNAKPRIEIRPDWPLLRLIHMPNDALLVLWRPLLDFNSYDGLRLGLRTKSSYRAFYNNLTLQAIFALESHELDGKIGYSQPLTHKSLLNRYQIMVRKNEGRVEADAQLQFKGSNGLISTSGRSLVLGVNFSRLLNSNYTFREVVSDSGSAKFSEWEDKDILLGYAVGKMNYKLGSFDTKGIARIDVALPGGDAQFTKLSSRLEAATSHFGMTFLARGNFATSFGPDELPLQDLFHAEGAAPRERFQHDIAKTVNSVSGFTRRYVQGGGFLRGYHGQPLPAERFVTTNLELSTVKPVFLGLRLFGFYDAGRIQTSRSRGSFVRSDAGFGLSFLGDTINLLGGNLSLFGDFGIRAYFPIWLSDPLPGEKRRQFRWLVSVGVGL